MQETINSDNQFQLVNLFRSKAMYTRMEMIAAAENIYKTQQNLFNALQMLNDAGMIDIRRRGHSTIHKRAIASEFRLSLSGLDWLANFTGDQTIPVANAPKKPRKLRAHVHVVAEKPQPCNVVMRTCYAGECYLRFKCDAFKGELWKLY